LRWVLDTGVFDTGLDSTTVGVRAILPVIAPEDIGTDGSPIVADDRIPILSRSRLTISLNGKELDSENPISGAREKAGNKAAKPNNVNAAMIGRSVGCLLDIGKPQSLVMMLPSGRV